MSVVRKCLTTRPLQALALAALAVLPPRLATAQSVAVGDPLEDYLRVLQLVGRVDPGSFNVRPFLRRVEPADSFDHPWKGRRSLVAPRPDASGPALLGGEARVRLFKNSSRPFGGNDGAVWQGKGVTAALDARVSARWGPLTVTAHPLLFYAQNAAFPLAPVTRAGADAYAYPWRQIDLPQRLGEGRVAILDPGQSSARLTWRGATMGFGTESLWWGPGIRNAIIMSDNAPGFPHGFVGTSRPVDVGFGTLEARWIWGRLQSSEWFDPPVPDTTRRFITGAVVSLTPRGLDGLSLGATRVFVEMIPPSGPEAGEYFLVFQRGTKAGLATTENPTGDDRRDQLLSLFMRWVSAASGFEAYFEWARNDHAWDLRDAFLEPEHSQAYTLGLQKVIPLSANHLLALNGEVTHLERAPTFQGRAEPVYYTDWAVPPGYTQRGQVLGSALGPGGNGQHLDARLYAPWGRAELFVERRVHDNDAYWVWAAENDAGFCCHDVSLDVGGGALFFVDDVEVGVGGVLSRELNRYFIDRNDHWNLNLSLSARWMPR
jgi:hypothetical protein